MQITPLQITRHNYVRINGKNPSRRVRGFFEKSEGFSRCLRMHWQSGLPLRLNRTPKPSPLAVIISMITLSIFAPVDCLAQDIPLLYDVEYTG
ncbi:hypothetical protein [Rhodopirellula bahusiensis]|uniref:hypothetical protein n=1 Tax=Rhodopirellula bahusiensis TaxID=2014065 RepID=UPI0032664877